MITKNNININFIAGLDTKTDPWQVDPGNFLVLRNQVFTKGKRFTKRNGFKQLTKLPDTSSKYATTLNGNLTTIGNSIYAYNSGSSTWVTKGNLEPMQIDTIPLIRNNINQIQCDSAVSSTGLVCTVYSEEASGVTDYRYAIADSITGQNIVAPTAIPVTSGTVTGSPRVFVLGNFFVIVFTNVITAVNHLQYIAISLVNPTNVTANADIAAAYTPSARLSWDGYVVGTNLYIAYDTLAGGQAVKVTYLSATSAAKGGAPLSPVTFATYHATLMSVSADITNPAAPNIWVHFYRSDTSLGFVLALDISLNTILAPTATITSGTVVNIASASQGTFSALFYEVQNAYSYDSTIGTNFINRFTISRAGAVTGPIRIIRGVGLASKAFITGASPGVNGTIYFLASYSSSYQPTYFVVNGRSRDSSPRIAAKLAYENGRGYLTLGLPSVTVLNSSVCYVSYLFKDLIAAVNKGTSFPSGTQTAGIYSQLGINLATFTVGAQNIDTAEIGNDLLITGGFLWAYDGYLPVEQNFFLYPDNVEAAPQADPAPTGTVSDSVTPTLITSVSSVAGITIGMTITGTGIPANTTVVAVGTTTITMSAAATSAHASETITFTGNQAAQQYFYQVTYEWTDNQGNAYRSAPSIPVTATTTVGNSSVVINIPTLRLTYKVANPVKIVIYRWSTAQQVYYQVTSLTSPILNVTTSDQVQYIDPASDGSILGNNIIYTNGGVVENTNGPGSNIFTIFDTRFWMVDAEDQNLLWFSKQVIENTPVEMSSVFTYFISPSQGAQGPTGPIKALAPMDDKLIVFKANAIYYINGTGPDNTGSNNQYSQPIFITSTVGCIDHQSIVFQPAGLQFQSEKGIWLLGRDLSTTYIGSSVEAFNDSVINSAVSIPETNQVRFTLDTGEMLMYDYYYGQWGTFQGVPAISSCIYQGLHTFINSFGEVYQENPGSYLDGNNPVLINLTSAWFNLTGLQGYQRAFFFYLLGKYLTPHKLQVSIAYDYNPAPTQTSLISPTNYSSVYGGPIPNQNNGTDPQDPYGQGNPYGGESDVEQWRVFLTKQRCQAFQISIQEIYDSSFGVAAGEGLTLSGINLIYGSKQKFRPIASRNSIGGGTR